MLTPTTQLTDTILSTIKKYSPCTEGIDWLSTFVGKTWGDVVAAFSTDEQWQNAWGIWFISLLHTKMDPELRAMVLDFIGNEPREAAQLYIDMDWLTVDERNILLKKFHSKVKNGPTNPVLPTIEQELKEKKMVPAFRGKK